MQIIKAENNEIWVENDYEFFGSNPNYFHSDSLRFLDLQNVKLDSRQYLDVISFNNPNSVTVRVKFKGRFKTEDEKYSDCLEYMISNL